MSAGDRAPNRRFDTALVLGGGGMFGAYQAGVWSILEKEFRPDIVIGASIGALNGWAIAGGCSGADLIEHWLDFRDAAMSRFRWPRSPLSGCIDRSLFEGFIERHYRRFDPQIPFAAAITRVRGLTPYFVMTPDIQPIHLQTSCALPVLMPLYRVDGNWSVDGGLMAAVPLWAAEQLGVRRVIAVNILPRGGPWWLRACRGALHSMSSYRPGNGNTMTILTIEHEAALGSLRDTAYWARENAVRLIGLGQADATTALHRVRETVMRPET